VAAAQQGAKVPFGFLNPVLYKLAGTSALHDALPLTAATPSLERAVSEAAVRDSGLDWTVLRPSGFMSNTLRWLPQLEQGDTVSEPFADLPVAVIDPFDIGAAAAMALTQAGHGGQSYRLTGPQALLPAERLAILGRVLGRQLNLAAVPDDDARREMGASMPGPLVDAFFEFSRGGTYRDDEVTPATGELLGRPPRTFDDWARAHAGAFG
jgi:uncharacterized protein YbjT (DUF2867 family)